MNYNLYQLFLELEQICSSSSRDNARDQIITNMFIVLLNRNDQSKILHMITLYESILLQMTDQVVPPLLSALQKDSFLNMESLMEVVQHLQPSFQFNHAEVFVDNLERLMDKV